MPCSECMGAMPGLNAHQSPQGQLRPHRRALRATTPFETPFLPIFLRKLEKWENWLQRGWSRHVDKADLVPTVWRGKPPTAVALGRAKTCGHVFPCGSPRLLQFSPWENVCSEALDTEA